MIVNRTRKKIFEILKDFFVALVCAIVGVFVVVKVLYYYLLVFSF